MEVKGTAIKTVPQFVKDNYPDRYNEWFDKLPQESKKIMSDRISLTQWYPLEWGLVEPTRLIGQMFYGDIEKGAFELGRYSSAMAIKGIYKMLVKVSSPSFIVNRASSIMTGYYRPCVIKVTSRTKGRAVIAITDFPEADVVVDHRVYGWILNTMQFSSFHSPKVSLQKSMGKGDDVTEFIVEWDE